MLSIEKGRWDEGPGHWSCWPVTTLVLCGLNNLDGIVVTDSMVFSRMEARGPPAVELRSYKKCIVQIRRERHRENKFPKLFATAPNLQTTNRYFAFRNPFIVCDRISDDQSSFPRKKREEKSRIRTVYCKSTYRLNCFKHRVLEKR